MKNKKFEFTFIHFLLIIIVVMFMIIIFFFSISDKYNKIKSLLFISQIKDIYNYVSNNDNTNIDLYSKYTNKIEIIEDDELKYCIILDENKNIDKFAVGNDKYYIMKDEKFDVNLINEEDIINDKYPYYSCNSVMFSNGNNCIDAQHTTLNDGDVYIDGMFEYKYNYHLEMVNPNDITPDVEWVLNDGETKGWGVSIINRNEEYIGKVNPCTTINDEPVISMKNLFTSYMYESDFSNFDTRNVIDMSYMFYYYHGSKDIDLKSFDTSKVENMSYMFNSANVRSIDMQSFNINEDANINSLFGNNRLLTKVYIKDEETRNLISDKNTISEKLNFILE